MAATPIHRLAVGLGVGALLVASGCGDDSKDMVRTGSPPLEMRSDGRLVRRPAPVTLEQLRRQPAGSPQETLFQLWFWVQWGAEPNTIGEYDPALVAAVGPDAITGAYTDERAALARTHFRVGSTRPARAGARTVAVELLSAEDPPRRESYVLRRRAGRWVIVGDTLLEEILAG